MCVCVVCVVTCVCSVVFHWHSKKVSVPLPWPQDLTWYSNQGGPKRSSWFVSFFPYVLLIVWIRSRKMNTVKWVSGMSTYESLAWYTQVVLVLREAQQDTTVHSTFWSTFAAQTNGSFQLYRILYGWIPGEGEGGTWEGDDQGGDVCTVGDVWGVADMG